MDTQKLDMFLMANAKFFPSSQLGFIRDSLSKMPAEKWPIVQTMQFKDPTTCLIVSLLAGSLGIDRFMIGFPLHYGDKNIVLAFSFINNVSTAPQIPVLRIFALMIIFFAIDMFEFLSKYM